MSGLSKDEVRDLIRATVKETLVELGMDVQNPLDLQADFQLLREWRLSMRSARRNVVVTLITIIIGGFCTAFWLGIKQYLKKGE